MAQPPIVTIKKVNREFDEKDYQQRSEKLIKRIIIFADLLRINRVPVHMTNQLDAMAAIKHADIKSRFEFYMALKTTMLVSHKYFPVFDQLFDQFWKKEDDLLSIHRNNSETKDGEQYAEAKLSADKKDEKEKSEENREEENKPPSEAVSLPTYSLLDTLKEKDFENVRPEELLVFDELFKTLRIKIKEKRGRRFKSSYKGKIIDFNKSIRQSRQKGGEIVNIFKKEKKPKHSKLVVLADVSGSMDIYSTFLIKFIYEMQKHIRDTETFVFGTQLKRITDLLSYRSIRVALSMLSRNVLFWSGGTNLGGSFRDFNDIYGGKLRKKKQNPCNSQRWLGKG
ncbi:VWA domain-containing protein [Desulfobacterium sp. N47]|uniref:VWA domain-containing protein n=1 Tax=Desulfobacterium sp. N47 TaxID=3115210 RepID=UPI003CA512F0